MPASHPSSFTCSERFGCWMGIRGVAALEKRKIFCPLQESVILLVLDHGLVTVQTEVFWLLIHM